MVTWISQQIPEEVSQHVHMLHLYKEMKLIYRKKNMKHSQNPTTEVKSNISSSTCISCVLTFANYYERFLCFTKNLDCFFHCRWICKTLWRSWRTTNWPLKKISTLSIKPENIWTFLANFHTMESCYVPQYHCHFILAQKSSWQLVNIFLIFKEPFTLTTLLIWPPSNSTDKYFCGQINWVPLWLYSWLYTSSGNLIGLSTNKTKTTF